VGVPPAPGPLLIVVVQKRLWLWLPHLLPQLAALEQLVQQEPPPQLAWGPQQTLPQRLVQQLVRQGQPLEQLQLEQPQLEQLVALVSLASRACSAPAAAVGSWRCMWSRALAFPCP